MAAGPVLTSSSQIRGGGKILRAGIAFHLTHTHTYTLTHAHIIRYRYSYTYTYPHPKHTSFLLTNYASNKQHQELPETRYPAHPTLPMSPELRVLRMGI